MRVATEKEKEGLKAYGLSIESCTCNSCKLNETCEFSFDPYNTDGDCLEEK